MDVRASTFPTGTLETIRTNEGMAALEAPFVRRVDPTPLPEPYVVAFNPDVAHLVGLADPESERPEFLRLIAGCARFASASPYAAAYAGHQFGSYAGQLGDGRAITLAEIATPEHGPLEWQVKGAGLTPFSRFGDGRAVLRSTIREYLCSEAMHALGIPTTRALAIAGSDEPVYRETVETAAVLTRLAPTHIRFGNFELFHYGGDFAAVKTLADYTIRRFYVQLTTITNDGERYAEFLRQVVIRTAELIAGWQSVGFAHGVMNTDNMSIVGITLDYGPFGFLDGYDAHFICNHTDSGGRYAFDRQPTIALWNCHALAAALGSLVSADDARIALAAFEPAFRAAYLGRLCEKLGFETLHDQDSDLFVDAFAAMQRDATDFTRFFRGLASFTATSTDSIVAAVGPRADPATWKTWAERYRARLRLEQRSDSDRAEAMNRVNPKYVLRNYIAQRAIDRARDGDYGEIARVHETLRAPFDEWPERDDDAAEPPAWASEISVSCSS